MTPDNGEPTANAVLKAIRGLIRHVAETVADDLIEKQPLKESEVQADDVEEEGGT